MTEITHVEVASIFTRIAQYAVEEIIFARIVCTKCRILILYIPREKLEKYK